MRLSPSPPRSRFSSITRQNQPFQTPLRLLALAFGTILTVACPYYVLDDEISPKSRKAASSAGILHSVDDSTERPSLAGGQTQDNLQIGKSPSTDDGWDQVIRDTVELYIPTMGNLRARQSSRLASQVAGRVQAVLVDEGDRVEKGQALVRLDSSFYEIEVDQRKAEVEAAEVAVTDANLLLERLAGLWNAGIDSAISRQTLDDAQAKRDGAEARLRQAEEALKYSRRRLAETVVYAPYAGLITRRFVDPGESVVTNPVTSLLELQETRVLELVFTLPQESMGLVKVGTPVEFHVSGLPGHVGRGSVEKVYPNIDEATRSFTSRAWIDNADQLYMPGMLAEVGVLAGRVEDVLTVPRRALSRIDDGWGVMMLSDGHTTLRRVDVGLIGMKRAEITQGLTEGDRVLAPEAHL